MSPSQSVIGNIVAEQHTAFVDRQSDNDTDVTRSEPSMRRALNGNEGTRGWNEGDGPIHFPNVHDDTVFQQYRVAVL